MVFGLNSKKKLKILFCNRMHGFLKIFWKPEKVMKILAIADLFWKYKINQYHKRSKKVK